MKTVRRFALFSYFSLQEHLSIVVPKAYSVSGFSLCFFLLFLSSLKGKINTHLVVQKKVPFFVGKNVIALTNLDGEDCLVGAVYNSNNFFFKSSNLEPERN